MKRVAHLQALYQIVLKNEKLAIEYKSDLLRSGVVFMHASLEDTLRQLLKYKSASDPSIFGDRIRIKDPVKKGKRTSSLTITDLYALRSTSIDKILTEAIDDHLKRRSFNDKGEVTDTILALGLNPVDFALFLDAIDVAIQRRHKIVHEGDRHNHKTATHGRPRALELTDFESWFKAVADFGKLALSQMGATELTLTDSN